MHRKSDSRLRNPQENVRNYKCRQEAKHNKQTTHKTTKKHYTYPKISNSQIPKIQESKNLKIQKPKNPKFQKSRNPKIQNFVHLRNLAIIFGFWGFRRRCLITVMDKWAKCAFLLVVGGVSIYIYIHILIVIYIYLYVHIMFGRVGGTLVFDLTLPIILHSWTGRQRDSAVSQLVRWYFSSAHWFPNYPPLYPPLYPLQGFPLS